MKRTQHRNPKSEQSVLATLGELWKGIYVVDWCHLCDTAIIVCPHCNNTSCNCSSCSKCHEDFEEFHAKFHTHIQSYLTMTEELAYQKGLRLRHFIVEGIKMGQGMLDFKALKKAGKLSRNDEEMFINGS